MLLHLTLRLVSAALSSSVYYRKTCLCTIPAILTLLQEVIAPLMEELATLSALPLDSEGSTDTYKSYTLSLPPNPPSSYDRTPTTIFIQERPQVLSANGTTGLRTWPASIHLATYLSITNEGRSLIAHKSVLELGSGAGMLAMLCAGPLRAAYVLATDGDAGLVENFSSDEFYMNKHIPAHYGRKNLPLEARQFKWGADANLGTLLPAKGGSILYDTILAADVTYDWEVTEMLAATIKGLLRVCPRANVLVSTTVRNEDTWDLFLAGLDLRVDEVVFKPKSLAEQTGLFYDPDEDLRIVKIRMESGHG